MYEKSLKTCFSDFSYIVCLLRGEAEATCTYIVYDTDIVCQHDVSVHLIWQSVADNVLTIYPIGEKGAVANIVKITDCKVCGGLFEINEDNLSALDCYEGYPKSYNRDKLEIKDDNDKLYIAFVYFRAGKNLGEPHEDYRKIIILGARDCGLPKEYIPRYIC